MVGGLYGLTPSGDAARTVAVVTDDVLALAEADPRRPGARPGLDSFDGHLYSVELSEPGGLVIELCAAGELEALLREAPPRGS